MDVMISFFLSNRFDRYEFFFSSSLKIHSTHFFFKQTKFRAWDIARNNSTGTRNSTLFKSLNLTIRTILAHYRNELPGPKWLTINTKTYNYVWNERPLLINNREKKREAARCCAKHSVFSFASFFFPFRNHLQFEDQKDTHSFSLHVEIIKFQEVRKRNETWLFSVK